MHKLLWNSSKENKITASKDLKVDKWQYLLDQRLSV